MNMDIKISNRALQSSSIALPVPLWWPFVCRRGAWGEGRPPRGYGGPPAPPWATAAVGPGGWRGGGRGGLPPPKGYPR